MMLPAMYYFDLQWTQKLLAPPTENEQTILNNIFIDKFEMPTCDKYCAIIY